MDGSDGKKRRGPFDRSQVNLHLDELAGEAVLASATVGDRKEVCMSLGPAEG